MKIIITNSSDKPIYEQISEEIKSEIFKGNIDPGDPLPSIRGLAKELKVSVITTKRAFEELEKEGLIETVRGKGSFVKSRNQEVIREKKLKRIEDQLRRTVKETKILGIDREELYEIIEYLYEEEEED